VSDPGCTFCRIVAGRLPAHVIDENEQVIVFLSLENHPLVVPKAHIRDIYGMPADLGAAIMAEAIRVSRAMKQALRCDGVYLTQANEAAAGQDVFHYHMHIYPCWGDTFRRALGSFVGSVTDRAGLTEEMKAATAANIRQALAR
jgi:histidine triad (HIT) family protein